MFLQGYGPLILAGTWQTVKLAVLSLVFAFVIGLIGAAAKLSRSRITSGIATVYTTLVRGDLLGWDQIDIDPFLAGVIVLGFIYGAYFTETFRGAFLSVPRGQLEAGAAYGMTPWQTFARIMFPQMMRFALPGLGNNWQVMVKATALVSIIGLADVVKAAQDAGKGTLRFFFFTLLAGAIYLVITTLSNFVLMWLERRYSTGVRKADL
jgi:histidine transport system permease protein